MTIIDSLIAKYRAVLAIGPGIAAATIHSTRERDRLDRQYWESREIASRRVPGSLAGCDLVPGGAHYYFQNMELEIHFLAPDQVYVGWDPQQPGLPYLTEQEGQAREEVGLEMRAEATILKSNQLHVEVSNQGGIAFRRADGTTLRVEEPPMQRLGQAGVQRGWEATTLFRQEERIYGLGERSTRLNHRQGSFVMWNLEESGHYSPGRDPLYLGIPVYLSARPGASYLVFYANSAKAQFSFDDHPGAGTVTFEAGHLHYYFLAGSMERLLEGYTQITGKPPLPPRWALGYHQSRWGYKTEADIREIVQGFPDQDLPLSAIHLDIDYMDGYRVFTIDRQRFPDLKKLADDLHKGDVRLVTILDVGVKVDPKYSLYQEGLKHGYFCKLPSGNAVIGIVWPGKSVFPDFTDDKVRRWWGEQYRHLLEQGVDGIWHDMNEPSSFTAWGDPALPLSTRHHLDGQGGDHLLARNLYGLLMDRSGYEGMQQWNPERRPWILSRSGWAGLQRYGWNWTGDVESSWEGLRATIATVLGLGLSGIPFSGSDTGGFSGNPGAELYLRWFQASAFMPFFRTHSSLGTERREPWVFGEQVTNIAREFLKMRCRLMPYLYTLAWQAVQTGWPLVRPLFWLDADDLDRLDHHDSFLLGDALLVAPVLEEGAKLRRVRLPEGEWYDFWEEDPAALNGPAEVELPTSLERIPVLVRGGSLIPMESGNELELHLYPQQGGKSQAFLYSDAGDGYGPSRLDRFNTDWNQGKFTINWLSEGEYPFPYDRVAVVVHGAKIVEAQADGQILPVVEMKIESGKFQKLEIKLQL